jgi:hypothetical protein
MSGDESAFPSYRQVVNHGISLTEAVQLGISKREYFAAKALQGVLADAEGMTTSDIVACAVNLADALIAELNKP